VLILAAARHMPARMSPRSIFWINRRRTTKHAEASQRSTNYESAHDSDTDDPYDYPSLAETSTDPGIRRLQLDK
jgi:hypothetical protein